MQRRVASFTAELLIVTLNWQLLFRSGTRSSFCRPPGPPFVLAAGVMFGHSVFFQEKAEWTGKENCKPDERAFERNVVGSRPEEEVQNCLRSWEDRDETRRMHDIWRTSACPDSLSSARIDRDFLPNCDDSPQALRVSLADLEIRVHDCNRTHAKISRWMFDRIMWGEPI